MRIRESGFTLVELLIVVIILGVLAAIVIPQFSNAAEESKEASVASALRTVRACIERYKLQHNETWPQDDFVDQLIAGTDINGDPGTDYGPYFRDPFPLNPINQRSDVKIKNNMPAGPEGDDGWIYAKNSGDFRANVAGTAPSGTDWFDL